MSPPHNEGHKLHLQKKNNGSLMTISSRPLTSLSLYFLIAGRPKSNMNIVNNRTCIMILLGRTDCAKSLVIFMLQGFDYNSHTIPA